MVSSGAQAAFCRLPAEAAELDSTWIRRRLLACSAKGTVTSKSPFQRGFSLIHIGAVGNRDDAIEALVAMTALLPITLEGALAG